jgi:uncharacterized protein YjbI with pentapeptide repeats
MKIEIKSRCSGSVLFSLETASIKLCLEAAVKAGADLRSADLRSADLRSADLRSADLRSADLSGAYLSGAYLSGADLSGADLSGADLSGADLRSAYLRSADLSGAKGIHPAICTPLLMLLDQPGPMRAYKLVTASGDSPIYDKKLNYKVGDKYEVKNPNIDVDQDCGSGINVATLDWCLRNWREGYRVLIVEFTAADIAAIPTANDGKFRLYRCTVVAEKDITEILAKLHEKPETQAEVK